jgi:hypothetical protein
VQKIKDQRGALSNTPLTCNAPVCANLDKSVLGVHVCQMSSVNPTQQQPNAVQMPAAAIQAARKLLLDLKELGITADDALPLAPILIAHDVHNRDDLLLLSRADFAEMQISIGVRNRVMEKINKFKDNILTESARASGWDCGWMRGPATHPAPPNQTGALSPWDEDVRNGVW